MEPAHPTLPLDQAAPWRAQDPALPGQRLGAWCLIRKLGAGGMGEVWLAQRADGLFEAQAAIKLLRVSGPGLLQRFARERALLARLQHEGIARLLDAGMDAGRGAYLVLEYVPGRGLADHVRDHGLSVAARVALLLDVARAVAHAHAQLVLHRDLKPGNVIVTPEGQPKLLDFGVAALLDDAEADESPDGAGSAEGGSGNSALTRLVGRAHTPSYAAPEHIAGEPCGVAADVYSLGVMLFELLSGELPYAPQASRQALEHAVLHTEPRRLGDLLTAPGAPRHHGPGRPVDAVRKADADLAAIAAKALRKRPQERYESVQALINDLQAWQQHRPVAARREHWRHGARLWLRRHALLAGTGALVTLSLGVGLGFSLWQWQRAEASARQAQRVTTYLAELLGASNPDQHGGRVPTVLDLLERSRRELPQRFADDPDTLATLGEVLVTSYGAMNRYDLGVPLAQDLLARAERQWGAHEPRTVEARRELLRLYTALGAPAQMVALGEPLREDIIRQYGHDSREHAHLLKMLLTNYAKLGRFDEAERIKEEGQQVVEKVYAPDDFERIFFANYVQVLRVAQGRLPEAEALLRGTEPHWASAPAKYARFVLVLQRNLLVVRMRQGLPGLMPEADAMLARLEALQGPRNEMNRSLRGEMARYLQLIGQPVEALAQLQLIEDEQRALGLSFEALRLPQQVALLQGRVLAGQRPAPAEWDALFQALRASTTVLGPNRAELALQLGRSAQALGWAPRAASALAALRAEPGLEHHQSLQARAAELQARLDAAAR